MDDDRILAYPNQPIPCPSCGDGVVVLTFWACVFVWIQSRLTWRKERKALKRANDQALAELRKEANAE